METGSTMYIGDCNGWYGNLAKIKVLRETQYNNLYEYEYLENYASRHEGKIPSVGDIGSGYSNGIKSTFVEARQQFINDMRLHDDYDIVKYIFEGRKK